MKIAQGISRGETDKLFLVKAQIEKFVPIKFYLGKQIQARFNLRFVFANS